MLINQIVSNVSVLDLLRYKLATEQQLLMLKSMNVLQSLVHYNSGGAFMDVVSVQQITIDKCIEAAGGWKSGVEILLRQEDPVVSTNEWPEFFRFV